MTLPHRLDLEVLGTPIAFCSDEPDWIQLLGQLWDPFRASHKSNGAARFELSTEPPGRSVRFPGGRRIVGSDPWPLLNEVCNEISRTAVSTRRHLALHAGMVAKGDAGVLLLGPAGAGKTTLTLALVDQGWIYGSDDLAPIDAITGRILPFPKPVSVKDPERWRRPIWPDAPAMLPPPSGPFMVPPKVLGKTVPSPVKPGLMVFPGFTPGSEPRCQELSPAQAAASSARNIHPPQPLDRRALRVISRLCAGAPGVRVTYGSRPAALAGLKERLAAAEAEGELGGQRKEFA